MSCSDARRNGVVSRGLDNVTYSIIYLHFQMETTPHCFNKSLGGSENGRSSFKRNGVVFGGANQAHAQIIGNHNTRVNRGGVVVRKASGVVFSLSDDLQFRPMKCWLRRIVASYQGLMLPKGLEALLLRTSRCWLRFDFAIMWNVAEIRRGSLCAQEGEHMRGLGNLRAP